MSFDSIGQTTGRLYKIKFSCLYGKMSFYCLFLSHFLVVKDYELPQSISHLCSVPFTLEYIEILSWSITVFLQKPSR